MPRIELRGVPGTTPVNRYRVALPSLKFTTLPVRFPAFRLIVKVVEQTALWHQQRVALERTLWKEMAREKKGSRL